MAWYASERKVRVTSSHERQTNQTASLHGIFAYSIWNNRVEHCRKTNGSCSKRCKRTSKHLLLAPAGAIHQCQMAQVPRWPAHVARRMCSLARAPCGTKARARAAGNATSIDNYFVFSSRHREREERARAHSEKSHMRHTRPAGWPD